MFIPLISPLNQRLFPRKGGGGGGGAHPDPVSVGHGTSSGHDGGIISGGSGSTGSSSGSGMPWSSSSPVTYTNGSTRVHTIPDGQLFARRTYGGATRHDIYGTSVYGSGYLGLGAGSVSGRSFPFWFWPVTYGPGDPAYLHDDEYGLPDNTSRPGGPLVTGTFISNSSGSNNTFYVLADTATVQSLIISVIKSCTIQQPFWLDPNPYDAYPDQPQPEEAVAYYRASSIALMLHGYNNTAALIDPNGAATPLPNWADTGLLICLNETIGKDALLYSGAPRVVPNVLGSFALLMVLYTLMIAMFHL